MKPFKKKFQALFGGRNSKIVKFYYVIQYSFEKFNTIKKIDLKYSFKFIPKIVLGNFFKEFQSNIDIKKNYYDKKYSFSYPDWFSHNINTWNAILSKIKNIKYLEIGSFEGRSAVFVGELINTNEMTCVDTFCGSDEHSNINFDLVYKNCAKNISKLNIKKKLFKNYSHDFFLKNNEKFNVIYIDGSHHYEDVKKDFINSMTFLEKNGILICDDFFWTEYKNIKDNPIAAIIECYKKFENKLEILVINHQIIFKKK